MTGGSSKRWIRRQSQDYYVRRARELGYVSRSAFKLEQIAQKTKLLQGKKTIVDLGAAPGGWCQFLLKNTSPNVKIVAVDIAALEIQNPRCHFIKADIEQEGLAQEIITLLGAKADLVLSDCSPALTGHRATDQARSETLAHAAFELAASILKQNGDLLIKARAGGTQELETLFKQHFAKKQHEKPKASRSESAELYLLGKNFILSPL